MEGLWAREKLSDPFRLPAFGDDGLRLPSLESDSLFKDIDFQIPTLEGLDVLEVKPEYVAEVASLPNLGLEPLPPLEPLQALPSVKRDPDNHLARHGEGERAQPAADDIWQLSKDLPPIRDEVKYLTWRNFHNPSHQEHQPVYLSEAGATAFDASLHVQAEKVGHQAGAGRAIQSDVLLKSLWQLGLGRPSVLFRYNSNKNTFEQTISDGRVSGTTLTSSQSIIDYFIQLGIANVKIRRFVEKTYASKSVRPSTVALARAIAIVQEAVETHCVEHAARIRSLSQLQALFEQSAGVLHTTRDLIETSAITRDDESLISAIYARIQLFEADDNLRGVMTKVLQQVARPWLDYLQDVIGIPASSSTSKRQALEVQNDEIDEDSFANAAAENQRSLLPDFVQKEERDKILEVNRALLFLQDNEPDHPLLQSKQNSVSIEWKFDWIDLERISQKAAAYQRSLIDALQKHKIEDQVLVISSDEPSSLPATTTYTKEQTCSWLAFEDPEQLLTSINALDAIPQQSLNSSTSPSDELHEELTAFFSQSQDDQRDHLQPPLSLSFHLSVTPLLDIQHRELTSSALKSILYRHQLRKHLDTLHSFQFCTSGIFTSRLAAALFDPEAELTERRKHVVRSGGANMGLKLGSSQRREWPPASSELRLALTGILEDSWRGFAVGESMVDARRSTTDRQAESANGTPSFAQGRSNILPGDLNFALRTDLPAADIDRILDANSIYALDFLKLNYTPPQALQAIFDAKTLDIYDRTFRLLLRLLRVKFVLGQIFRNTVIAERGSTGKAAAHRLRHRANHFIQTVVTQFMYAGIGRPWAKLNKYLDELNEHMTSDARKPQADNNFTFAGLIKVHQDALATIGASLLLRNRQRRAATALEVVLSDILAFSDALGDGAELHDPEEMYKNLEQHIEDFINACIGSFQKNAHIAVHADEEEAEQNLMELMKVLRETL